MIVTTVPQSQAWQPQKRYVVETGRRERVHVLLVGCGGTGSFLALHLARMAYHAKEKRGIRINLTLIDPDQVEEKNIGRQNFCPAEVGRNKARALMERYNRAFGLDIVAYARPFDDVRIAFQDRKTMYLMAGCVDNPEARRGMQDVVGRKEGRLWWLDGGNHDHSGQVLLGNEVGLLSPAISPLGVCTALPSPGTQHPELLVSNAPPRGQESDEALSCADLAVQEVQGLMVNQAVAGWMASYIYRLLLSYELDMYATYFDLLAGSARSTFITKGPDND